MAENDRSFMNRRDLTLGAMAGGASLLFSAAALAQQDAPANRTFVDVTKVGAIGDGKTDSTAALQHAIDAAAEKFGMPMGPIELADQVGLDICLAVGDMLRSKFGDLLPPTPAWLRDKVANGELGRKTGKGFYVWKDGKADKTPAAASPATSQPTEEMIDRLILPMSNVCVACLREGIVDNADMVDGAMIFGTGYAPFRGGPLNYARTRGPENVVSALRALAQKFGGRFTPDAGWDNFK